MKLFQHIGKDIFNKNETRYLALLTTDICFSCDGHQFQLQSINWNVAIRTTEKWNLMAHPQHFECILSDRAHIDFIASRLTKHIQNDGGSIKKSKKIRK